VFLTQTRFVADEIPWLLVSSIPQWKSNCHEDARQELFQTIGCIDPTLSEALQQRKMISSVQWFKSGIKTGSFVEDIITSNKEVSKHYESNMVVGI
jgi:hypothetical protein